MKPEHAVLFDRSVGPLFYRFHTWLYRRTGGRFGRNSPHGPMILLTYTGRKTGRRRTTPLLAMPDGDGWVVVASNGGRPQHPGWYHSVRANPDVEVQDGPERIPALAEVAGPARRAELWPRLRAQYEGWAHYQTLTDREIPVVELRRARRREA